MIFRNRNSHRAAALFLALFLVFAAAAPAEAAEPLAKAGASSAKAAELSAKAGAPLIKTEEPSAKAAETPAKVEETLTEKTGSSEKTAELPREGTTVPVPADYKRAAIMRGRLEKFTYPVESLAEEEEPTEKTAFVYIPCGYDKEGDDKYDILYLLHGWDENAKKYFTQGTIRNMLDHMIDNADIPPMIVVSASFYAPGSDRDFVSSVGAMTVFHNEFVRDLMPAVEENYHTYAKSVSKEDLKASRDHRAFGGFSLGSVATWNEFCYDAEYIRYYLPMSGACWYYGGYENYYPKKTCSFLERRIRNQKLDKSGFFIYAATGTEDLMKDEVDLQMREMFGRESFFDAEHTVYYLKEKGKHDYRAVQEYLYNALPRFFTTK